MVLIDVNKDGANGFLFDLGIIGQRKHKACFVYSSGKGYVEVAGFADLSYPEYDVNEGIFIVEEPGEVGYSKYRIIGEELCIAD